MLRPFSHFRTLSLNRSTPTASVVVLQGHRLLTRTFSGSSSSFSFDFPPFVDNLKATIEQHVKSHPFFQYKWPAISTPSLVQHPAPDFTADAVFADNSIKPLTLSSYKNESYVLLVFYPLDFTFVCPSELIAFDSKLDEFKKRGVEVIGISVDSQFSHCAWKSTPRNRGGIGDIRFPLVADLSKQISRKYGVLTKDDTVALRGLFLIDKEGIVRHSIVNDLPLGRSVDEAIRMVDALQHFEQHGEVCPANWKKGSRAMKASAEGVAEYLSSLGKVS